MGTAAGAAGFMLGSGFLSSGFAADCDDPRPIPGGNQFLFPDPRLFHVLLPGFPSFPNNNPATNDPSLITNFNGHVGLAYVDGTGTHTNLTTGAVSHLPFEVDLRFMKGTYVGLDGRHHHGAFALIWLDVFGPAGQIHDFNPGIAGSGLFWTTCIDEHDVSVNPGNGRASMQVRNLPTRDYHDLGNALVEGPFVPAVASFEINWTASNNKRRFHYSPEKWDANVVLNSAQVAWSASTATARFVSDPASTSTSLFAEVGHERNGVFFS